MKLYWSSEPDSRPTHLLRNLVRAQRLLPSNYARKASLELSRFAVDGFTKIVPGADPLMHARWGRRTRCEGNGSVNFFGGFYLENDVLVIGNGDVFFGPRVWIDEFTTIMVDRKELVCGMNLRVGSSCHLDATGGIHIGDNVMIESGVQLLSTASAGSHGIRIGSNVRIGAGAVVLDGARITDGATIAAGAIVSGTTARALPDRVAA